MTFIKFVDLLPLGGWAGAAARVAAGLAAWVAAAGQGAAGQGFFEGTCVYKVEARSKMADISDADMHKVLAIGNLLTVTMKDGNYKLHTEYADTYILKNDHHEYIKFRRIDTVLYLDFSADTDRVTGIIRNNSVSMVGGVPCKEITIETSKVSRQYYYSTTMRTDPDDDRGNTLEQAGVYAAETGGGLKMWIRTDYPYAVEVDSCIRVEPKRIPDQDFRLPDLPVAELFGTRRILFPRFPGGDSAWRDYVAAAVNPRLAEKYVKFEKGEKEAWQTVILEFAVAEDGTVSGVQVVNPNEVDPHLAEEAMRVMKLSPKWLAASFYGEKVKWVAREAVSFSVSRK